MPQLSVVFILDEGWKWEGDDKVVGVTKVFMGMKNEREWGDGGVESES